MSATEPTETIADTSAMDTSNDIVTAPVDDKTVNGVDESNALGDSKTSKRKRPSKKATETEDISSSLSNGRPKRTLSKRK
jgi:hypothetical protein